MCVVCFAGEGHPLQVTGLSLVSPAEQFFALMAVMLMICKLVGVPRTRIGHDCRGANISKDSQLRTAC